MNAFLIISTQGTSEWMNSFNDVQIEMGRLEESGIVSNVKVQKFEKSIFTTSLKGCEYTKNELSSIKIIEKCIK